MGAEIAPFPMPMDLWSGVVAGAEKHNLNLIAFVGGNITEAQNNIIYDMVTPDVCSGIVNWSIRINFSDEELSRIFSSYKTIPMTTIFRSVPGCPKVNSDDFTGMQEAVTHLVKKHGYRRLAFIRGREDHNPLGAVRYRGYRETLEKFKIPLDHRLITPEMDWTPISGSKAVSLLLDERRLRPGKDIDAIVSASDLMLTEAQRALQNRGIRIPDDIALLGFNNSRDARVSIPAITSVDTHLYDQGFKAVSVLHDLLNNVSVPKEVLIPSHLTIHQSCGCLDETVTQADTYTNANSNKRKSRSILKSNHKDIVKMMIRMTDLPAENKVTKLADELLLAFTNSINNPKSTEFLSVLRQTLQYTALNDHNVFNWHGALSAIQYHIGQCRDLQKATVLLEQGRTMIGQMAVQRMALQQCKVEQHTEQLKRLNQKLLTTFNVTQLTKILTEGMSPLGIPGCYLALYENPKHYSPLDPAPEWSRLIVAYDKNNSFTLEPGGTRFKTHKVLPDGMWPRNRRYTMILQELYLKESHIGFVLFEVGPHDWPTYDTLRAQISSSLQCALLFKQAKQHTEQLDRVVAETMTTTEQMEATQSETSLQAQNVFKKAQESMDVSKAGQDVVTAGVNSIKSILHQVDDIATTIMKLSKHTSQIEEIIDAVQEIVDQLNILAVNANIQAAKTGEQGRKFAVVATEMRNLAEQSQEATDKIGVFLNKIHNSAKTAVQVTEEGKKSATQGSQLAIRAGETIQDLTGTVEEAAKLAAQIAVSTKQQTDAMAQLVTAMKAMKKASSQTSLSLNETLSNV